ncbi:hypothetical protein [Marinicella meishanensis]|uniref:hypothetical protein n=1 Tax=Marinicella meishanensis TaxID=2873263 RepID=UPI001CBE5DB4|nr:hypothetical protein [Marinicella sp. NBU2979]
MAILIAGATKCSLCQQVIEADHEVMMFPAFIPEHHRLYRYSDASLHQACYQRCADHDELEDLLERYWKVYDQRPMPPPEAAKNFDAWYNNSKEVKIWQQQLAAFWERNS